MKGARESRKGNLKGIGSQEKERADKLVTQEKDREIELARIAAEETKADKDRELERDRIAAQERERADRIVAQDKDRELERDRIAAQDKDRELEEAKIAANERLEMARIEGIAEQAERNRELKRTELETDKESKLLSEIRVGKIEAEF